MRVIRGEPVEVWLRDGRPIRFVWRGRMYTVMFVLDRRLLPTPEPAAVPTDAAPTDMAPMEPAPADGADLPAHGRECWRVEATPERTLPPATYELCHDLAADRWSLSRS